jgi:nicotinate-nucleotide--dimethylbenzimidazole phosphoribosyltransferase
VTTFAAAAAALRAPDPASIDAARAHLDRLTKPIGSLGRLEELAVQLAGVAGACPPPLPEPAVVVVFAADHGVVAEGVTPWPQEVTAQMVANFCAGGAAINVLARHVGATVVVVDVGVAGALPELSAADDNGPRLIHARIAAGTANLARGAAMTTMQVQEALDVGCRTAQDLVASGARCLATGDMGIGNTTAAAATIAALTGRDAAEVTGRGTGIDDARLRHKIEIVEGAIARLVDRAPLAVLAEVGGLEIAALAGFIVGAGAAGVPVVIDGVIAAAALLAAATEAPAVLPYVVCGHRSTEPGATAVLDHLGLEPLLDLHLRLGEGTGACLALPILQASALILAEMATFDSAGVTKK